jgi:2-oxoglutarate ferredoxin oxidoreductase subunit beta
VLRKAAPDYDPQNRGNAFAYIKDKLRDSEFLTGLLYVEETSRDMHALSNTAVRPLVDIGWDELCPGSSALPGILKRYR